MKNRTVIGVVCIILAVAITFGISPLVNKMTEGKTQVVVFSKDMLSVIPQLKRALQGIPLYRLFMLLPLMLRI